MVSVCNEDIPNENCTILYKTTAKYESPGFEAIGPPQNCFGFRCYSTAPSTQKRKIEQEIVKNQLQNSKLNDKVGKKGFGYRSATECGANPYHLLSPTISRRDLVDPAV